MPRKGAIPFVLLAVILLLEPAHASFWTAASRDEMQIYSLVNGRRARKGLSALEWDDRLASVARGYSAQMARDDHFEHEDRDGRTVIDRAMRAGVRGWRRIGENLFYCEPTDEISHFAVEGWMRSPSHRDNILDRKWTATGIGIFRSRDGRSFITEIFIQE